MDGVFINSTEEYLIASFKAFCKILDDLKITDEAERQRLIDLFAQYSGLILGKITQQKIVREAKKVYEKTH